MMFWEMSLLVLNITTDAVLSLMVANDDITITRLNDPSVFCTNTGCVHFVSCSNITIIEIESLEMNVALMITPTLIQE